MSAKIIPPHSRCNFVRNDSRLLVGAYPLIPEGFDKLLDFGINVFVNLTNKPYKIKLPSHIIILHSPILPGRFLSRKLALQIVSELEEYYHQGKKLYIHCEGGHGRAGTLMGLLLGKLFDLKADEVIVLLEKGHAQRLDSSRSYIPTPETNQQVKFLVSNLGLTPGAPIPDRSDRSWLRK